MGPFLSCCCKRNVSVSWQQNSFRNWLGVALHLPALRPALDGRLTLVIGQSCVIVRVWLHSGGMSCDHAQSSKMPYASSRLEYSVTSLGSRFSSLACINELNFGSQMVKCVCVWGGGGSAAIFFKKWGRGSNQLQWNP